TTPSLPAGVDAPGSTSPAAAGVSDSLDASLTQRVEVPEALAVGEPLTMSLEITHPEGALIQAPEATGTLRWRIASSTITSRGGESGPSTTTIALTLVPLLVGKGKLDALPVIVLGDGGERLVLTTAPLDVKVLSRLAADDPLLFRDPRPPVPIFNVDYSPLWVGLGSTGLVLLGLIGFLLLRRGFGRAVEEVEPRRDMYEVVSEKLGQARDSDWLSRGELERYYSHISEAMREYLGERFGFPGTELTSTEIMARLHDVTWPDGLSEREVEGWLRRCDRVKFADDMPDRARSEETLRRAFSIVELTRVREVEGAHEESAEEAPEQAAEESLPVPRG
ncbi:unnamed protein product, partial [Laminaria digitata]